MAKKNKSMKKSRDRVLCIDLWMGFFFLLAALIFVLVEWSKKRYGVGLDEILYTVTTPMKGTDSGVIELAIKECVPRLFQLLTPFVIFVIFDNWLKGKIVIDIKVLKLELAFDLRKLIRRILFISSLIAFGLSIKFADEKYELFDYIKANFQKTYIYEEYYVDPKEISIESPDGNMKNLIFIYLESMETTYLSEELGGNQSINLLPNLTNMAYEHVSFSDNDNIGGFREFVGASWTMGSLFSSTTGIPFSFPIGTNNVGKYEEFATGVTALGDILEEKGYVQEFMCGSDASYAGRADYFKGHGNYKIFDLYSARDEGYIDEDYYVWWGYQDRILYDIAKEELLELSKSGKPFNLTMLTVDTHFPGGYYCEACETGHSSIAAAVVACADNQVYQFIEWCKQQDFYEDTVIVLMGDHQRMDGELVEGVDEYDRTIYNCFINTDKDKNELYLYNREFAAIDIMPTVVSALGFDIEGDRIGLGTNLFSNKKTLIEELGYDYLEGELNKKSDFYLKEFK